MKKEKNAKHIPYPEFGNATKIEVPEVGGVRYSIGGDLIGFLEP